MLANTNSIDLFLMIITAGFIAVLLIKAGLSLVRGEGE